MAVSGVQHGRRGPSDPSQRDDAHPLQQFSPQVRAVIVAAIIALSAALMWALSEIILLVFASILIALALDAMAAPITRKMGMRRRWAVLLSLVCVLAVIAAVVTIFGTQISAQLADVAQRLPEAIQKFAAEQKLQSIKSLIEGSVVGDLMANAISWGTTVLGGLASLVLVISAGVFLALDPERYHLGLLQLVPDRWSNAVADGLNESALALRHWFTGQLLAMIIVGIMTGLGLWLIGIPAYLGLGLIAGLTEFIPILGPIAGAVPAVLLASLQDWTTVLYVIALFVVIQQVENNIILPVITGRAVLLPPAIGIFGVIAFGVVFGPLGLLLGYPLCIVADVMVRRFYVRGILGKDVTMPSDA